MRGTVESSTARLLPYPRRVKPHGPDSPWRLNPEVTFLNHGSFGACPVPVLEAQRALIDALEADPIEVLWETLETRMDTARREVAAFISADPEGLVFLPNATTGVSTVLRSLRFEPGDELLTTNHEYNAVLNAQAEIARLSGASVVMARLPLEIESDDQVVEAVVGAATPRTRSRDRQPRDQPDGHGPADRADRP